MPQSPPQVSIKSVSYTHLAVYKRQGMPLTSGLFADIYHPVKPAFREYAVFFHDELEIDNKDGQPPVDPHTGLPNGTTAISYRSEPMRNRLQLMPNHEEGVTDEDISMSSWAYGEEVYKRQAKRREKKRLMRL